MFRIAGRSDVPNTPILRPRRLPDASNVEETQAALTIPRWSLKASVYFKNQGIRSQPAANLSEVRAALTSL